MHCRRPGDPVKPLKSGGLKVLILCFLEKDNEINETEKTVFIMHRSA